MQNDRVEFHLITCLSMQKIYILLTGVCVRTSIRIMTILRIDRLRSWSFFLSLILFKRMNQSIINWLLLKFLIIVVGPYITNSLSISLKILH